MSQSAKPLNEFDEAVQRVLNARTWADLFGADEAGAARTYRRLAKLIHPDRVAPSQLATAGAAFSRLSALWSGGGVLDVRVGPYRVGALIGHDELADYFSARSDVDVLLKVAHRPSDNDLLRQEASLLRRVRDRTPSRYLAYLPTLRDSFTYRDEASGADRVVNVFDAVTELVSLANVGAAFPDGMDARDVAWMWRRLLVALGLSHRAGVIHGAVVPDHVLIHPAQHGVVLANWCYATAGGTVPALVRRYRSWYAPEIARRGTPTPGSDIYLATRCMVALMGARAPQALSRFAKGCLLASPATRPDDAWRLLTEFDDVLGRLYGPRRFRPLALPATVPAWPQPRR